MRKHCCNKMGSSLDDKTIKISYFPMFRQYAIKYKNNSGSKPISYCPWCGEKFPKSLAKEWSDELEKIGFDDPFDENILLEFKDDRWWKNRQYSISRVEE